MSRHTSFCSTAAIQHAALQTFSQTHQLQDEPTFPVRPGSQTEQRNTDWKKKTVYKMLLIFLIRHFKTHGIRSTTCRMRKIKWYLVLRCVKTSLLRFSPVCQEVQFGPNTVWDGCKSWTRHLREKVRSFQGVAREGDYRKLLSWPEDPEPARFRPPSRSKPVQPCRRKAPSPPHLRRTHRETLSALLDILLMFHVASYGRLCAMMIGWYTVTQPTRTVPVSSSPGIILMAVLTSFQFWACSNFQSRMKLLLSVTTGPWEEDGQCRPNHSQVALYPHQVHRRQTRQQLFNSIPITQWKWCDNQRIDAVPAHVMTVTAEKKQHVWLGYKIEPLFFFRIFVFQSSEARDSFLVFNLLKYEFFWSFSRWNFHTSFSWLGNDSNSSCWVLPVWRPVLSVSWPL